MFFFLDNVSQGMASYAKETSLNQDMFLKTSRKGLRTKVSVVFMTCYVNNVLKYLPNKTGDCSSCEWIRTSWSPS